MTDLRPAVPWINYHHLLYFWTVVRTGSIAAAAVELRLSQPAISSQIKTLERSLKLPLFTRRGRRLELTEIGRVVARYAEEIFTLGRELRETLGGLGPARSAPLRIGVVDALPKLLVHRLLKPAIDPRGDTRLVVFEDKLDRLIADLATHELDVVFADAPSPPSAHVKAYNHLLVESPVGFFATGARAARLRRDFPRSLDRVPVLLPTINTSLRRALDVWFGNHRIQPIVVAEIEDSAVVTVFAEEGVGAFAAPTLVAGDLRRRHGAQPIGLVEGAHERLYAVTVDRKITHPGVKAITDTARTDLRPGPVPR